MLYNPDWKNPTRPGPVSAKDFIAWLESHDPTETYNFLKNDGYCLMGQYMATKGIRWGESRYDPTTEKVFNSRYENAVWVLSDNPQTFGAALQRTKKFLKIKENA